MDNMSEVYPAVEAIVVAVVGRYFVGEYHLG